MNIQLDRTKPFLAFITQVLKGMGQVFLQENILTGLLFLCGLFYGSVFMGIAAIVAATTGTLTAHIFKLSLENIQKGLYGFSPALVGVAMMLFFNPEPTTWILIITGSILATLIQHFFISKKIPVFTMPFVLVTWGLLYLGKNISLSTPLAIANEASEINYLIYGLKGFGQVFFQDKIIAGVLFFVAVLINSPLAAFQAFIGAILAGILASIYAIPNELISEGLFSFNAVLCVLAFPGKEMKDGVWTILAVLISVVFSIAFFELNLPQLTFPFVAASMLTLLIKYKGKFAPQE